MELSAATGEGRISTLADEHLLIMLLLLLIIIIISVLATKALWNPRRQLDPFLCKIQRPLFMVLSGGVVAAKRAFSATREDRISALPDELLVTILLLNNAADAARTSVLSRRWRSVWTQLPDLHVPFFPEPVSFRRALTATQLRLQSLEVQGDGATLESLAIWLPPAAHRLSGSLVLLNHAPDPEGMPAMLRELKSEKKGRFFEMPCFEKATKISLDLGFLPTFMPLAGEFAQLTVLVLERVWFNGAFLIGDSISTSNWRCPCLQVLKIHEARGLSNVVICSKSLLELELTYVHRLRDITIEAAVLNKLTVVNCSSRQNQIKATILAPQLVYLDWRDFLELCYLDLDLMPHLQHKEFVYFVYGPYGGAPHNSACMKLLKPFKPIETLAFYLVYLTDLSNFQYLMEDMKVLPNPATLRLTVLANGHSFGPSSFHILRMCLGIKKLVVLLDNISAEATTPCLPGCICNQQPNWEDEELLLINLQEIEIQLFRGSEHEVTFVKRLLIWATALNKMTVILCPSTTKSKAKELFHMFKSLSKPRVCMKLMYAS